MQTNWKLTSGYRQLKGLRTGQNWVSFHTWWAEERASRRVSVRSESFSFSFRRSSLTISACPTAPSTGPSPIPLTCTLDIAVDDHGIATDDYVHFQLLTCARSSFSADHCSSRFYKQHQNLSNLCETFFLIWCFSWKKFQFQSQFQFQESNFNWWTFGWNVTYWNKGQSDLFISGPRLLWGKKCKIIKLKLISDYTRWWAFFGCFPAPVLFPVHPVVDQPVLHVRDGATLAACLAPSRPLVCLGWKGLGEGVPQPSGPGPVSAGSVTVAQEGVGGFLAVAKPRLNFAAVGWVLRWTRTEVWSLTKIFLFLLAWNLK